MNLESGLLSPLSNYSSHASDSSFLLNSPSFDQQTHDAQGQAKKARRARLVRILRLTQSTLSALLSLLIAIFQGKAYVTYRHSKNIAGAWPKVPDLREFSRWIRGAYTDDVYHPSPNDSTPCRLPGRSHPRHLHDHRPRLAERVSRPTGFQDRERGALGGCLGQVGQLCHHSHCVQRGIQPGPIVRAECRFVELYLFREGTEAVGRCDQCTYGLQSTGGFVLFTTSLSGLPILS